MLFDYGVMHSFISVVYVHCLYRHVKSIGQTYKTILLSDDIMFSNYWLRAVPVVISVRNYVRIQSCYM